MGAIRLGFVLGTVALTGASVAVPGVATASALAVVAARPVISRLVPTAGPVIGGVRASGVSASRPIDHFTYAPAPVITRLSPASGFDIGGTTVEVIGSGLRRGTTVTFGGVPGTRVEVVSSRVLFVNTPRHADGPVAVRARNVFGTSRVTVKTSYSYVAVPAIGFSEVPSTFEFIAIDVSCASATFCLALGFDNSKALWSVFNGRSWSASQPLPTLSWAFRVDCESTTSCLALGFASVQSEALASSRFTGSGWTAATRLGSGWSFDAQFDCASPTFCLAVSDGFGGRPRAARFDGRSWAAAPAPGVIAEQLSCYAVHICTAIGRPANGSGGKRERSSTFNGRAWSAPIAPPLDDVVLAFSCVSRAFCLAVGMDTRSRTGWAVLGAGRWSARHSLPAALLDPQAVFAFGAPLGLSCLSPTWCMLLSGRFAGSQAQSAVFTGAGWGRPTALPVLGFASGGKLSCMTRSACVAALDGGALTSYTGTWSTTTPFGGEPTDVSCTSATFCLAVDAFGHALRFDGGTWTAVPPPAGVGYLDAVSCTGRTRDGERRDRSIQLSNGNGDDPGPVSDRRESHVHCVALGVSPGPFAVTWNGRRWSEPTALTGLAYVSSVACVAWPFCMVVGGTGARREDKAAAVTFNGTSWTAASIIAGLDSPSAVSCASARFCVASGMVPEAQSRLGLGTMSVYTAGTWKRSAVFGQESLLMNCARGRHPTCVATDGEHTWTSTTSAWHKTGPPPSGEVLDLSCPARNVCIGGGDNGRPRAWLHTTAGWSDAIPVDTLNGETLFDLSCPTTSFCVFIPNILGD